MANLITESVSGYLRFQLIQVGLENRLFDVIEETIGKTTKQIANEANCDERYTEEWCQVKKGKYNLASPLESPGEDTKLRHFRHWR